MPRARLGCVASLPNPVPAAARAPHCFCRGLDLPIPDLFVLFNSPVPLCPTKSPGQDCTDFSYFSDLNLTYLSWVTVSYVHDKPWEQRASTVLRGGNATQAGGNPHRHRKCLYNNQVREGQRGRARAGFDDQWCGGVYLADHSTPPSLQTPGLNIATTAFYPADDPK
jgi:hypothetical protein